MDFPPLHHVPDSQKRKDRPEKYALYGRKRLSLKLSADAASRLFAINSVDTQF